MELIPLAITPEPFLPVIEEFFAAIEKFFVEDAWPAIKKLFESVMEYLEHHPGDIGIKWMLEHHPWVTYGAIAVIVVNGVWHSLSAKKAMTTRCAFFLTSECFGF
jgi:hypothetical protein